MKRDQFENLSRTPIGMLLCGEYVTYNDAASVDDSILENIDATKFAGGTYLYRPVAGDIAATKKLVLLKLMPLPVRPLFDRQRSSGATSSDLTIYLLGVNPRRT
jgi:hypothetical protein